MLFTLPKLPKRFFGRQMMSLLVLTICLPLTFQAQQVINFDDQWKFHLGHAADPAKDFNYSVATIFAKSGGAYGTAIDPRFNDSGWRQLSLPHDWAVELPFVEVNNAEVQSHGYKPVGGLFPATSIGWYRKHFIIPAKDSANRVQIRFDGIFRDAKIWVNGLFVAQQQSGYIGDTYDITDDVLFGKENVIVVRVDATQYEGWFYEGAGIYRHAWLQIKQPVHIPDGGFFAYTNINPSTTTVICQTEIRNQSFSTASTQVFTYLVDRKGQRVAQSKPSSVALSAASTSTVQQQFNIRQPHLWSLEDPYLYRIVSVVMQDGRKVDSQVHRFGIRSFRMDANEGFFLNGKYLKIQGTNNHQDHAGVGAALPDGLQYHRIRLLKNMGVNAYRTSHHPPTPELLDACDSLGMLVLDEQRLLNSSGEYLGQMERMIRRDRNHPSIFLWSIGNEEGWIHTTPTGKRIAQTLLAKQQALDPSRTSTYAADVANVFQGVNEVIPVRGFNYRQFAVADYHRDHPKQPLLGTEMGSTVTTRGEYLRDSIRGYLPDQDITAPWWASTAETWWTLAAENKFWLGGFVWTGFDYRGEPTPFAWPNIHSHFGILDVCGFPKNIYYYYKSWWTDKDVLHLSPHWNWYGKEGQPIDVWVNSNADSVALYLNAKKIGTKTMPRNGHLLWSVPYRTGKLEAVAFKKGKTFSTSISTTNAPAEVVMTPYSTTLLADGKSVSVINISIIDAQGREVATANNRVRFSVEGNARIIGVGNGDPSSHEPDQCVDGAWERNAFNGKCQVIVQAGMHPGTIHVEATAMGLWKGATDIVLVAPASATVVTTDNEYALKGEAAKAREVDQMLGADISFLPELEAKGMKFSVKGQEKDVLQLLNEHGFNYVRLRIFNEPGNDSGYSPKKGFCDLEHTLQMAKRVKAAGLKLLLDFHYSDYWADPGKQYKPAAWKNLSFPALKKAVYDYTFKVMKALQAENCTPAMVQVGNEINHGMLWPEGSIEHPDSLAQLIRAGTAAVKAVDPKTVMLLHVALGGQNDESVFFIEQMLARDVHFDVIGESYYPKWHGTLEDLENNLEDLVRRFNKDVLVVEYTQLKKEVNKIAFEVPRGKGTCIWEPLNTWEQLFDREGKANEMLDWYDEFQKRYLSFPKK